MISLVNDFFINYKIPLIFVTSTVIFISSFYTALHTRKIPQIFLTPIWYVGLSSLFTVTTITVQWALGPENHLSYTKLGTISEISFNLSIFFIAVVMFIDTVREDVCGSKRRHR